MTEFARNLTVEEDREGRRRVALAFGTLLCVIVLGTIGFMWAEGWNVSRALYFTLVTITTVGYGDEGISGHGRTVAAFLLVLGIGSASFSFALLVQYLVADRLAWRRRMQSKIDTLEQHVIVCGFGRMGRSVCEELAAAGHAFVVVEKHPPGVEVARAASYLVIEGSASEDNVLEAAGIRRARHLVCTVDTHGDNIVVSLTARELNPELHIVARAELPTDIRKLRRAGADRVVSPFQSGGQEIAGEILQPGVARLLARSRRAGSNLSLAEIPVTEGSALAGMTLRDCGTERASRVSFVALERPGEEMLIPPPGSAVLQAGDLLIVAGDPAQIETMLAPAGAATSRASFAS